MKKHLILLVGPPGSGKSTIAEDLRVSRDFSYINQDKQGKQHLDHFRYALEDGNDIVVDRMNFSVEQRKRYLEPAKAAGYTTEIIVLHECYATCFVRCIQRKGHETIKDADNAKAALDLFFSKYERVQDSEADKVTRNWPSGHKPGAIICDLDGTLCNIDHRLHHVKNGRKDWKQFFEAMTQDRANPWCLDILRVTHLDVVFCSGRPDDYKNHTVAWLNKNARLEKGFHLLMRRAGDFRADDIVKEIILDFEILTRFAPAVVIDDRQRVVDMWRRRGLVCLQCAEGEF